MEKRISFYEFQSVKSVAKACDPIVKKRDKILAQIDALADQYKAFDTQIKAYEAGVVKVFGVGVDQLVKKVTENGMTKYVPTDIVRYDDVAKKFVVTLPDPEGESNKEACHEVEPHEDTIVPPTTADGPGSDFDEDREAAEDALPFEESQPEEESIF